MAISFVELGMDGYATRMRLDLMAVLDTERSGSRDLDFAPTALTFEGVYREHYRDVYRYVLLALRRIDDVEDVVADTFDRAFEAWRSGHGPSGRALPWLIVIARRIVIDRWRRRRLLRWLPFQAVNTRSELPDPDDSRERAEFWIWLAQLADVLSGREREVVFLRYQRDLSDEDIGEILGLSASGVRTLVSRALASLRQHPELWS
jgi:RNA polymerase sigma-70 factor (ECF subfamily)